MKLVAENSPILSTVCETFDFEMNKDTYLLNVIDNMYHIMDTYNGIGLAAPQVGIKTRLFIMGDQERKINVLNPEILESSKEKELFLEGCLSFPNLYLNIKRPETIVLKWFDEEGKEYIKKLSGIQARIAQHEIDHLDGIVFQKRVSKLKLKMAEKKRKKHV